MELYIVLAIMVFMIIGFLLNKWPFGVTTMTCCVLLAVTKVFTISEAFSGFSNKTLIMLAGMFALVAAFQKTSLIDKIQASMIRLKNKSGMALLIGMYIVIIAMACFMPTTAIMLVCLMFLVALGDTGDITPSRMTIPCLAMLSVWGGKLPIAMGATSYATMNAVYGGMIENENHLLQVLDMFKVSIIPCLLVTVYCLFAYKFLPSGSIDQAALAARGNKPKKEKEKLPKYQETIIYVVFVVVMLSLFFNKQLGDLMYIGPALAVLVLIFTKCFSVKEAVSAMTMDSVWMIAGVLVMADALGKTGAGELIGETILKILGGNPSGLMVMFVFAIVTTVMTTFMSNSATANVLMPVAATVAVAAGWDPRGIILIVRFCSNVAIAFPSGSPACGIAYATCGLKLGQTLKFTLPLIAIAVVSVVFCANFFFPVYG